jgi:hypothetical protein
MDCREYTIDEGHGNKDNDDLSRADMTQEQLKMTMRLVRNKLRE